MQLFQRKTVLIAQMRILHLMNPSRIVMFSVNVKSALTKKKIGFVLSLVARLSLAVVMSIHIWLNTRKNILTMPIQLYFHSLTSLTGAMPVTAM
jgi:hypothetical protein